MHRVTVAVGLAVPVLAAVYGYARMGSVDAAIAAAKPVKIGVVQGNQELFNRSAALAVHKRLTNDLKARGAELVVVGNGRPHHAADFVQERALDFPVLVDPELRAYAAAGLRRGLFATFSLETVKNAIRSPVPTDKDQEPERQIGRSRSVQNGVCSYGQISRAPVRSYLQLGSE